MSNFKQSAYDIALLTFPATVTISICFIVHGIAMGWH